MALTFNSSVIIYKQWIDFKLIVINLKSLSIQYDIDTDTSNQKYIIFAIDGDIAYVCNIWLGFISPDAEMTYSQEQNDIDRSDFEFNYLSNSNARVSNNVVTTASSSATISSIGGLSTDQQKQLTDARTFALLAMLKN